MYKVIISIFFVFLISCSPKTTDENQTSNKIITRILASKTRLEKYYNQKNKLCSKGKCLFLIVWDFDGTLLKGDCTTGYKTTTHHQVYKGLAELAILQGLSSKYKGANGFQKFYKEYRSRKTQNYQSGLIFTPRAFAGTQLQKIQSLVEGHFNKILKNYYFSSSIKIMQKLKKHKIQSIVISASPHFFVQGSANSLPLPLNNIFGIESKIKDGIITPNIIKPITYASGKRDKLIQILKTMKEKHHTSKIFILAGFGNSFGTDGPFLEYIAKQEFPVSAPLSVMINGGEAPQKYKNLFLQINLHSTIRNYNP